MNKDESQYKIVAIASPQGGTKAQREAIPGAGNAIAADGVEESIQRSQGKGQELTPTVREPMEDAFGFDFGRVRIHADTEGDRLSRSLEARAFTTGEDIFFRQGAYAPDSPSGKKLLAHELTHVVQQSSEASSGNSFFTHTAQRVSEEVPHFVQREAEATENSSSDETKNANKEVAKAVRKAQVQAFAMGAAAKGANYLIDRAFSSSAKPTIKESLIGDKLTLQVSLSKPEKQKQGEEKKKGSTQEEEQALPDELVNDIVGLIQKIVNQAPQPDIVQKKLDKVRADFDLDALQVVSTATIGSSFTYDIRIKGNPKQPEKDAKEVAKDVDNMASKGGTLIEMAVGFAVDKAFEKVGNAFKSKEKAGKKEKEKEATSKSPQEEKAEKVKTPPPTEKEKGVIEEGKEAGTSTSKQKGEAAKKPLDVNTKIKRIDTATVEVSVRADSQEQKKDAAPS